MKFFIPIFVISYCFFAQANQTNLEDSNLEDSQVITLRDIIETNNLTEVLRYLAINQLEQNVLNRAFYLICSR